MATPPTQQQMDRDRIDDEAADWFLLMAEQGADPDFRERLEEWRSQSALHQEIWERTCAAYRLVGEAAPQHQEHWRQHADASRLAFAKTLRTKRRLFASGALLAMAAAVLLTVGPGVWLRLQADFVTTTAEVRAVTLPDGTRVQLSPESALEVSFAGEQRTARLLAGQAFFEVAPQSNRPFTVVSGSIKTRVLGTAFDVRLEDGGSSVAVQHGHVRVEDERRTPQSHDLVAGDSLRMTADGGVLVRDDPPGDVGSWKSGQYVARNRTIAEIVDMVRPYFGGVIVVRDDAFSNLRVSGIYDLRDPVGTVRNLASLHGATMRQVSPWFVIVTAR